MTMKHTVSEQEWQARVELAAAYRLVALYGWDDLIFTHISMRVSRHRQRIFDKPVWHDVSRNYRIKSYQSRSTM